MIIEPFETSLIVHKLCSGQGISTSRYTLLLYYHYGRDVIFIQVVTCYYALPAAESA